jgi:hypothetical protein
MKNELDTILEDLKQFTREEEAELAAWLKEQINKYELDAMAEQLRSAV